MISMNSIKSKGQHAVTTRFSTGDYAKILELAEEKGTTVAGIVRFAWASFIQRVDFDDSLILLERRLTNKVFDICCSVNGLNEDERKEALDDLEKALSGVSEDE